MRAGIDARLGWSPATVHRVLRNEKYVGRWVWNKSDTRRDPRSGRRRQSPKRRRATARWEAVWAGARRQLARYIPSMAKCRRANAGPADAPLTVPTIRLVTQECGGFCIKRAVETPQNLPAFAAVRLDIFLPQFRRGASLLVRRTRAVTWLARRAIP